MEFEVFTIFPEIFASYLDASILHRAQQNGIIQVHFHNIRDWALDKHHMTDDVPYGGGGGMVMKPEPIFNAVKDVLGTTFDCPLILLTPQGRLFSQKVAVELALLGTAQADEKAAEPGRIGLLCGRYEGVDERVRQHLVTDELSIGDYVLTGGELAAMLVIDAVTRLLPGVLGDPGGAWEDSHASGLLEHAHYTRPQNFHGWQVPEVLLSGDHARIKNWRREQSLLRTWQRRPDLLARVELDQLDKEYISKLESSSRAEYG